MNGKYFFPLEKLDVWNMALNLGGKILHLVEQVPQNKHIRLVDQMRGAAISPGPEYCRGEGGAIQKRIHPVFTYRPRFII
jgi:hypothetical protein